MHPKFYMAVSLLCSTINWPLTFTYIPLKDLNLCKMLIISLKLKIFITVGRYKFDQLHKEAKT